MTPGANDMPEFLEVARVDQLPPGSGRRVTLADKDFAVFNVDGTLCAIADTCPHYLVGQIISPNGGMVI